MTTAAFTKPKIRLYRAALVLLSLVGGALPLIGSAFAGSAVLTAIVIAVIVFSVLWKPHLALALLIPTLFLEHELFSLELPFGRVRIYHLIIVLVFARIAFDALTQRAPWRTTAIDLPLTIFLGINALALAAAPELMTGLKILGLEVLLAMLFWSITNLVRTRRDLDRVLNWLIGSIAVTAILGISQVVSTWLAQTYDIFLWTGPVIHSDLLPFGRPYATFVEPDWFGAVMMIGLILTFAHTFSVQHAQKQLLWIVLMTLMTGGLVLSGVRAAWLGAFAGIATLWFINRRVQIFNFSPLRTLLIAGALVLVLGSIALPDTAVVLFDRFVSIGSVDATSVLSREPRLQVMQEGIAVWQLSPWIGHGPGGFNTLGHVPSITETDQALRQLVPFQTNMVVNVLIDAGVAGLVIFGWLLARGVRALRVAIRTSADIQSKMPLLALSAVLIGLAITYQVTTGMWLALTWAVFGIAFASVNLQRPAEESHAA